MVVKTKPLLALCTGLFFFGNTVYAAEPLHEQISVTIALDMSDSMQRDKVLEYPETGQDVQPAEAQLIALNSALRTFGDELSGCYSPFQLQVVYWGEFSKVVIDWITVYSSPTSYYEAADKVGALSAPNYQDTVHAIMQERVLDELAETGSAYQIGIIVTDKGASAHTTTDLTRKAHEAGVQLHGISIDSESARVYLNKVADTVHLVHDVNQLTYGFKQTLLDLVPPVPCLIT